MINMFNTFTISNDLNYGIKVNKHSTNDASNRLDGQPQFVKMNHLDQYILTEQLYNKSILYVAS
jgi:hypothetical protein